MNNTNQYYVLNTPLSKIHTILIELLNEVDRICKKNNIEYFLSGGTLLGSIRHNGFIPWDDDLDLWMTRKNYKIFKKCLKKDLNSAKFLYEDYFTNIRFPLSILKIKRKDTVFIEKTFKDFDIAQNIYLDIFPLDKVVKPFFRLQTHFLIRYQSMRLFKLDPEKSKYPKVKRIIYFFFPLCFVRFLTETTIRFFNWTSSKKYGQLSHRGRYWPIFTKDQVTNFIYVKFENNEYPVPVEYDSILKMCYGDYLRLPPPEKRRPSHDIIECKIQFEV